MAHPERNIKTIIHITFFVCSLFVLGCSSSNEIQEDEQISTFEEEQPEIVQEVKQEPQKKPTTVQRTTSQQFTVQADTVDVQKKNKQSNAKSSVSVKSAPPKRFYTIEVGAFRLQSNIKRHQVQLAARFKLPVRILYDSTLNLTRVCVGTFSTKSLAVNFIQKMQTQFPNEYPDLWISYWTK